MDDAEETKEQGIGRKLAKIDDFCTASKTLRGGPPISIQDVSPHQQRNSVQSAVSGYICDNNPQSDQMEQVEENSAGNQEEIACWLASRKD